MTGKLNSTIHFVRLNAGYGKEVRVIIFVFEFYCIKLSFTVSKRLLKVLQPLEICKMMKCIGKGEVLVTSPFCRMFKI